MPKPGPDALADRRQLVVILRVVATAAGRLLYGEVVDADGRPTLRFRGWPGMTGALRSWLAQELDSPEQVGDPADGERDFLDAR